MAGTEEDITFEKYLAPGVRVLIDHVPAIVREENGTDRQRLFSRQTASRIEQLLAVARQRMAMGEMEIHLDFKQEPPQHDLRIEFLSTSVLNVLETYRQAFDRVTCAFDSWAINTHPKIVDTTESLAIWLDFEKSEPEEIRRLVQFRNALIHFASANTPLVTDESTLSMMHCLVPHRGTSYDRVRLWLSSDSPVELTERSRDLIVSSWLQARRESSRAAKMELLQGVLHAVTAGNLLVVQLQGVSRKSRLRYQPALGIMAREYLGYRVNLTCIVDRHHGKTRYEAIEMEPIGSTPA